MYKDQRLLKENLIWAMARNYSIKLPDEDLLNKLGMLESLSLSYALVQDDQLIIDYLTHLKNVDKHETFLKLFFIGLISFAKNYLDNTLPLYSDHEKSHYNNLNNLYLSKKREDIFDEVQYTRTKRYFKQVPMTILSIKNLDQELNDLGKIDQINDFIKAFDDLLSKHFFFNDSLKDKKGKKENFQPKNTKKRKANEKDVLDDYYGLIGSAEFTKDLDLEGIKRDEEKIIAIKKEDEKKYSKRQVANNLFGQSILSPKESNILEKDLCYGVHKSSKIIISKGQYDDNLEANFRKSQLEESLSDNEYYLDRMKYLLNRSKNKMKKDIKNALSYDLDLSYKRSKNGHLDPSIIYRGIYLRDSNIFQKDIKVSANNISIDILIDGSASQLDRKSRIASWAYTICQALTEIKIPTRVMTFSNLESYLGLTIFRDYLDSQASNEKILTYSPAGSNRDGLAFRLITYLLDRSPFRQKIFIYLTDGKPFDVRSRVDNNYKDDEKPYKDQLGENDTAIEFRKLEDKGIFPLAIFTGNEEDLDSMKKIYGSNFAYIKDINRFASIITQFLKKILTN